MPRDVGVIVVAAGRGTRVGGAVPKQYEPIGGVPMLVRATRPFLTHPDVAQVAVVLPPSDVASPPSFLAELSEGAEGSAPLALTAGGLERRDSVARGLAALSAECQFVLVHDAARPFVEPRVVDEVIGLARAGYGAVPAVPVSDTLKRAAADDPGRVERTVAREGLWRAQTPQGFPRALLERAYAAAPSGAPATDDAALVEAAGGVVRLVADSARNLKVTTADDLALADDLARGQG